MYSQRQLVVKVRARALGPVRPSRWVVVGILAFALPAPTGAFAAAGPSGRANGAATAPGDRAATRTLLNAEYELVKATLARNVAVESAVARAAEAVGHECKGVLDGAPDESAIEEEGPLASEPRLSGHAQGERARSEQEKQTIDLEIGETIFAAAYRVLRGPDESFIATADRLGWSDPTINALVHQGTAQLREALVGPPVAVCAEMRTWAASGFHVLPPGSRSLKEAREARSTQAVRGNLEVLLQPYEDAAGRTIVRRTTALRERFRERERTNEGLARAEVHMELALGEKLSRFAARQLAPVIGKGRTSAGTTFVIRPIVGKSSRGSCRHEVEIEVHEGKGGSGGGVCLSAGAHSHPSGSCSGSVETVELATPPAVRQVRVRFRDGRIATVSVVQVPAKDGGPAGVFINAFRGYNAHPVSLQELSRDGRVLRTVSLSRVRCTKELAADGPGPPQPVSLATLTAPSGEPLTISAILLRFRGRTEFSLGPQSGIRNSEAGEEHGKPKQFQWGLLNRMRATPILPARRHPPTARRICPRAHPSRTGTPHKGRTGRLDARRRTTFLRHLRDTANRNRRRARRRLRALHGKPRRKGDRRNRILRRLCRTVRYRHRPSLR